ncbi:MAG: ABC transporter substrate-binding protein [Polyangiaceae bacterium]|nr:ABC transporter substrate-binding protein [Polyangiaceae bacterium]
MKAVFMVVAWLALLMGVGCSSRGKSEGAPAGKQQVKLALNWVAEPEFGGFFAARESGAYERSGLSVEIMGGGAGVPVLQMLAAGQIDFGVVGAEELLSARGKGADLIPIFAVYQTSPQAIMAHASRGAKGMKDVLASGTLAIEPGAAYGAFLKKKHGIGAAVVPYDGGVARFVVDKDFAQQCYATSEPLAARRKGADPAVFLIADEGYNPYATVVAVRRELWQRSPDVVRAFVRASREGWRSYLADPRAANAVMAKLNTAMDAETFAEVAEAQKRFIETEETRQRGIGVMSRERWEALGAQLVELGFLQQAPKIGDALISIE